jgi:hypothetical protein
MMKRCNVAAARYQPYASAYQSRFQWRHREFDPWRRLMDASCFVVDWITRPRGPTMSQYGGHWSHIVTCAHVVAPWQYPNFYPPVGNTRFVSKLTMSDTQAQIRIPSLQGDVIYRHFLSPHHFFTHSDQRLDLACGHAEQNFKRSGEMKLVFVQNEGFHMRPRLEVLEELQVGDIVWIHGMTARGDIFDEEDPVDPLMIPTGVRARVKHLEDDHFFLDTSIDALHGEVSMGMCGSPVIKDGKCYGMLTATVHEDSENRVVAGTAMCTYARDIRSFLIEVEQQMKNPPVGLNLDESPFMNLRREEAAAGKHDMPKDFKDWDADGTRLARHIPIPISQWKQQTSWTTEEDSVNEAMFGRSGAMPQEAQEQAFGLDMNESDESGKNVSGQKMYDQGGDKLKEQGVRDDTSPLNHFIKDDFVRMSDWDTEAGKGARQGMRDATDEAAPAQDLDKLRRSIESLNRVKQQERAKRQTMETLTKLRDEQLNRDRTTPEAEDEDAATERKKSAPKWNRDDELEGLWGKH